MLLVANDDEVGDHKARSALAMFAPPVCRSSRRNASRTELILRPDRSVGSDEGGGFRRTARRAERAIRHSELGERGIKPGSRVAVLRRSEARCFWSPNDDEVGDHKARSAPSELGERGIKHG
jgi:hypothetical protein